MNSVSNTERYVKPDEKTNIVITAEPISECRNDSFAVGEENTQSQVLRNAVGGVSLPEKNLLRRCIHGSTLLALRWGGWG